MAPRGVLFSLCIVIPIIMTQTLGIQADGKLLVVEDYEPDIETVNKTADISAGYVVLEFGVSWNATCLSKQPILWTYFEASYKWEPDVFTSDIFLGDTYRPYRSVLHIRNTSAASVGRYYCVNAKAWPERQKVLLDALVTERLAGTLYVYVKDPMQHLVPLTGGLTFIVYPDENVTIPCKPSQPNMSPNLCLDDGFCYTSTDPSKGFIMPYGLFQKKRISLDCHLNGRAVYRMFLLVATRRRLLVPFMKGNDSRIGFLGESIILSCSFLYEWHVPKIRWKAHASSPLVRKDKRIQITNLEVKKWSEHYDEYLATQELRIENASYEDSGNYRCEVSTDDIYQYDSYNLIVRQPGHYVTLQGNSVVAIRSKHNDTYTMSPIEISVPYWSNPPQITFKWFKNGKEIPRNNSYHSWHKYVMKETENNVKLTINEPKDDRTDVFSLTIYAGNASKSCDISVVLFAKPTVQLTSHEGKPGELVRYSCNSTGYPLPELQLWFRACNDTPWRNCSTAETYGATEWTEKEYDFNTTTLTSTSRRYIKITRQPGVLYCQATNSEGNVTALADVLVSDMIKERIVLKRVLPQSIATTGDNVVVSCLAVVYYYTGNITLEYKGKKLNNSHRIEVSKVNYAGSSLFAWQANFTIKNVNLRDSGNISCFAEDRNGQINHEDIFLEIATPTTPSIDSQPDRKSLSIYSNSSLELLCVIGGVPEPEITWFKDGVTISEKNDIIITKQCNRSMLTISRTQENDTATYKCIAKNKMGMASKSWIVKIDMSRPIELILLGIFLRIRMDAINAAIQWLTDIMINCIEFLPLLLTATIVLCIYLYCKKTMELKAMKAEALKIFAEGNLGCYNPALALNEQADLLPYNADYEFPMESLVFLEQLGSGAYGVVMKAKAIGIKETENETTVAVKMIRKQADNEAILALVTELKIMIHLGQHVNVVNLLGAVTKNISKRKLMVIVEFCPLGSVKDFLLKCRPHFIDQIVSETGEINRLRRSESGNLHNSEGLEPNTTMKNEDPEPTVNTTDLICWAAQVASGMEYLASRNVLHGDLAARNVLLCHDNVVKICDFGLARSMYKCDKYKKKQEALLPFKWLALECIGDGVFSTFSDIWAYGVFLWELFSLAKSPYPGMDANEELYNKLLEGYRLEKPRYANQDIYDIMLPCWNETPDSRPSFQELKNQFNAMLPDEIREHLSKLNEPYVALNAEKIKRGVKDYLANFGASDKVVPSAPEHVNVPAPTDTSDVQQHNYVNTLNMTCNQGSSISESRNNIMGEIDEQPSMMQASYGTVNSLSFNSL